jgi:hypothetical protein
MQEEADEEVNLGLVVEQLIAAAFQNTRRFTLKSKLLAAINVPSQRVNQHTQKLKAQPV